MKNVIFTRDCGASLSHLLYNEDINHLYLLMDENSYRYCLGRLRLDDFPQDHCLLIPSGEAQKSLENVMHIWKLLSDTYAKRNAVLLNLGGGVVTDMGGFAASCFKRGIRSINIPTTLLSQIDASVGGKTGVDFNSFKNEIGTFYQPESVLIDNHFLETLPRRQILSGFAEMLKHALLSNRENYSRLVDADLDMAADEYFLTLIEDSIDVKSSIVKSDFKEEGLRKALNFGHTIGHAIESAAMSRNIDLYHGEAVAYGLIAELYLSVKKFGFDPELYHLIRDFIRPLYPEYRPIENHQRLYDFMLHDKKNLREGVNFTLLHDIGKFETDQYCDYNEIVEALEQI